MQAFDVINVPLKDKNLIEASAGTGKTYSIAILVLRLIIEQKIPIHQILMVTFTNAAVAELEMRIRNFVKEAYDYTLERTITDTTIIEVIEKAYETTSRAEVKETLKDANLLLDELSVQTIHGFCQQTLLEFAFESNQMFGAELISDQSDIITKELNTFWRSKITTLPIEILSLLDLNKLRIEIQQVVTNLLSGRTFGLKLEEETSEWNTFFDLAAISQKIDEKNGAISKIIHQKIEENAHEIVHNFRTQKPSGFTKYVKALEQSTNAFWELLQENPSFLKKNILLLTDEIANLYFEWEKLDVSFLLLRKILQEAGQSIAQNVQQYKRKINVLNFDALITNLYEALCATKNIALETALRNKFKAVFVDEFQDTDREQFEIFKTAFGQDTIMFLIGDPKQSIYAWRKADINTYFNAKHFVDHLYGMNTNYRSSSPMIEAMNHFFVPEPDFDTFGYQNANEKISYTNVNSPNPNHKGVLLQQNTEAIPMHIVDCAKKEIIFENLVTDLHNLLFSGQYTIASKGTTRLISVEDIGILVRSNGTAKELKSILNNAGIPAIVINDEKLFESEEVVAIGKFLKAILAPNLSNIRQALLTNIMQFDLDSIFQLDEAKVIYQFQVFKQIWIDNGISALLRHLILQFKFQEYLLAPNNASGKRQYANILQLIEVMHKAVTHKHLNPEESYQWLQLGISGALPAEDEYIVRIETDEKAVQIVTIHASKGLEYNIVLAPELSLPIKNTFKGILSFRNTDGEYIFNFDNYLTPSEQHWYELQADQENRRLLYVAITRSVYACYLYQNTFTRTANNSSFTPFVNAIKNNIEAHEQSIIVREESEMLDNNTTPNLDKEVLSIAPQLIAQRYELQDNNWMSMSFSKLNAPHELERQERTTHFETEYDKFIFQTLKFGAHTGTYLHSIFEQIPFNYEKGWSDIIQKKTQAYYSSAKSEFNLQVEALVKHTLGAQIFIGPNEVKLNNVKNEQRLNELEFYFPYEDLELNELRNIDYGHREIGVRYFETNVIKGLMNGFIDLVFEQDGKFYILDWKSNYLGYDLDNYNAEGVLTAMNNNGYHLQYLIYIVALTRYLRNRNPNFDYDNDFGGVIYIFLRGAREGKSLGIYADKPTAELIEAFENALG